MIIMPLRGSILQVGTCQILSLAENPRWSRVWQQAGAEMCQWCWALIVLHRKARFCMFALFSLFWLFLIGMLSLVWFGWLALSLSFYFFSALVCMGWFCLKKIDTKFFLNEFHLEKIGPKSFGPNFFWSNMSKYLFKKKLC